MNIIQRGKRGTWRTTARVLCLALVCGLAAVSVHAARGLQANRPASPAELYQQATHQEDAVGNMEAAIDLYRRVIAAKPDPALAARAQLRMAVCYEKLGKPETAAAYEVVVRDYADQAASVAVARAWLNARGATASQQANLSVERIWSGPEVDLEGRPSPDGRYLPFADWKGGTANLAVRDLKTGENRLLTHDATAGDWAENPVPSADGKQIAYRFGEKDSTIRLINADGTHMRVLVHDGHKNYVVAWSPDGKYLASMHNNDDRTKAIVLISTADGSTKQLKSTGSSGATLGGFSPDGRFLVYAMNKGPNAGNGGVFALAADASVDIALVQGSAVQGSTIFTAPMWSPDGRRILFISDRSGARGLWSVRVTNGRPEEGSLQLIQATVGAMNPRGFTRDGSFYYGTQETQVEAFTADLDPETLAVTKPVPVTDRSVGNNQFPALSPDGKYVAFRRSRASGPNELVVRSLVTGEERTLTNSSGPYGGRDLQWFPDSRSILLTEGVDRRKRFRQVDIESGEAQTRFDGSWEVSAGALSADGKAVFYSIREQGAQPDKGTLRLVKRRLETGEEAELYRTESSGIGFFGLAASPDGTRLSFSVNAPDAHVLMIVPTEGGTAREIYRLRSGSPASMGRENAMAWTKDGRHLVFSGNCGSGDGQQLCAISTAGGDPKPLDLRMQGIPSRMISADGRRIAFTGSTSKSELWVIRNLLSEPAKGR